MNETFYKFMRGLGRFVFGLASQPLVLHPGRAEQAGPYLLVANHESPFDVALLIAATPRVICWLSIVELFQHPLSRWFLTAMGASPLDRRKVDPTTVRALTRHLHEGRVVGMFPEGGVRLPADSVFAGGALQPGFAKLAQVADVPVLPCVVVGGGKLRRWTSWLPLRHTRWAVAFGEPLTLRRELQRDAARAALIEDVRRALAALYEEVRHHV